MVKVVVGTLFSVAAADGTLAVTWEDCGDASTHGKITKVEPTEITIGSQGQISGEGTTDKELTAGTATIQLLASLGIKETYDVEACSPKTIKLPLNLGSVTWHGLACPVAAGTIDASIDFTTSAVIPAALATADVTLSAVDQDGEKALCLTAHLKRSSLKALDCSTATCTSVCECASSSCNSEVTACLADSTCASAESCVFGCACGDTICAATCAATSGSSLAGSVVQCLASSCTSSESLKALDCSTATCTSVCECASSSCNSEVTACLADSTCASAESCVFGCACGDTICAATCAASSGSSLAGSVVQCLASSCTSSESVEV